MRVRQLTTTITKQLQRDANRFGHTYMPPLKVDGVWGPKTEELVCATLAYHAAGGSQCENAGALRSLIRLLGKGGEGGNNAGEWLDTIRRTLGVGLPRGSWCALIASHCYRGAVQPSAGAKELGRNALRDLQGSCMVGSTSDLKPEECALIVWDRGDPNKPEDKWKGHVGFCIRLDDMVVTVCGNEDPKHGPKDRIAARLMTLREADHRLHSLVVQR